MEFLPEGKLQIPSWTWYNSNNDTGMPLNYAIVQRGTLFKNVLWLKGIYAVRRGISHRATAVSFCWLVFDITGGIWSFRGNVAFGGGTGGAIDFRIGGNATQRSQIIQNGIIF